MSAELDLTEATAALGRLAMGANYAHDVRLLRLALERLKALPTPPADDVREALAARLAEHAERFTRYSQPCGFPDCPFMVRRGDGGWNHLDTHGAHPGHPAIGLLTAAAQALSEVRPRGTVTDQGAWACAKCGGSALEHSLTTSTCVWEPQWRGTVTDAARVLADPKGGCSCEPFDQDAGGGYTEHLLEYEPDCPEHSTHLYDPRKGEWIIDPRGMVTAAERPYSEAVDVEHGAWETDDIEERAHDLLAVVAHRRAEAAREVHP